MIFPLPGMDPYLEHPVLWETVHARLIVALANQLQPRLDPRYVTSIEERVFVEGPQRRIPDVWLRKADDNGGTIVLAEAEVDPAAALKVDDLEIRQTRIETLHTYTNLKLVTLIKLGCP